MAATWAKKVLATSLLTAALVTGLTVPPAPAADTFTVDQTIDTPDASVGDGDCDVSLVEAGFQCTLRAAIQEANATSDADLIRFFVQDGTTEAKTIDVGSLGFEPLPAITEAVTIDGYTQPGASPNTTAVGDDAALKIELNGASVGGTGLEITSVSGDSVIKGLAINGFGTGVAVDGDSSNNRIEGLQRKRRGNGRG